jgi:hypothetical protein
MFVKSSDRQIEKKETIRKKREEKRKRLGSLPLAKIQRTVTWMMLIVEF